MGPFLVLERVGEEVFRVQMPPKDRKVTLHRDRMAPYGGNLTIYFQKRKSNPLASQNNMDIDPLPHTPVVHESPSLNTPHSATFLGLSPVSLVPIRHTLANSDIQSDMQSRR